MTSSNPHGGPPVTFIHGGTGRGPEINVPTNPVVNTPQGGTSPVSDPHSTPFQKIDQAVGPQLGGYVKSCTSRGG